MRPYLSSIINLVSDQEQQSQPATKQHQPPQRTNHISQYVYDKNESISQLRQEKPDPNRKHIEIYQFQQKKHLVKSSAQKILKCKFCTKKIDITFKLFRCEICRKFFHPQCLVNLKNCPRCQQSANKNKQKLAPLPAINEKNHHPINRQPKQSPSQKQTLNPSSQGSNLSLDFSQYKQLQQVKELMKKYPQCFEKYKFRLPIPDDFLKNQHFLQELFKEEIKPLPEFQELPEYFDDLIVVWNFYTNFQSLLELNQVCRYSIAKFEQELKEAPISKFLSPLLQLIFKLPKSNLHTTELFKTFQDLNQSKLLPKICKYFWTVVLSQLIRTRKNALDDKMKEMRKDLEQKFQKRKYKVQTLQEKLRILKFVLGVIEESGDFKKYVGYVFKGRVQEVGKIVEKSGIELAKLRESRKNLSQKLSDINKRITALKDPILQQFSPNVAQDLKQSQKQKSINLALNEQLNQKIAVIRSYIKIREQLGQFEGVSKVKYLGKDRDDRSYWYLSNDPNNHLIFISETMRPRQGEVSCVRWGFYYGSMIEVLSSSLNRITINESRLKVNIEKLIALNNLITTTYNEKVRKAQQQIEAYDPEEPPYPQTDQFLDENVLEINLSQMRKIFVETHRIFNQFVQQNDEEWEASKQYLQKTQKQKFKSLADIKSFMLKFAQSIHQVQVRFDGDCKKRKKKYAIWSNRKVLYASWMRGVKNSNKNPQIFMLALILYLEVVRAIKYSPNETTTKKSIDFKKIRSVSPSQSNDRSQSCSINSQH